MSINSRSKGKRGELDLCRALREVMGWTVRRSQQFCGKAGDADLLVDEAPDLFVECKLVQKLNVPAVMRVAVEQAKGQLPLLCHRRDREEWLVTLRLSDLPRLRELLSACGSLGKTKPGPEPSGVSEPTPT